MIFEFAFWRRIKFAFAGGVAAKDLAGLAEAGANIVDVGRSIIDAPLLDFRLDVRHGRLENGMGFIGENHFLD